MHPYENLDLDTVGYVLAAWLICLHLWMLAKPDASMSFLRKLPRNNALGSWLMGIAMAWFWLLIAPDGLGILSKLQFDLGEFNNAKKIMRIAVPVAAVGMIMHVKEFISVRALGTLALMAAAPLLYSAYQEPTITRLLIPIFAYGIIIAGFFMVSMPFVLRDAITWLDQSAIRYKAASLAGLGYGVAVLVCAILWW